MNHLAQLSGLRVLARVDSCHSGGEIDGRPNARKLVERRFDPVSTRSTGHTGDLELYPLDKHRCV